MIVICELVRNPDLNEAIVVYQLMGVRMLLVVVGFVEELKKDNMQEDNLFVVVVVFECLEGQEKKE